MAHVACVNSVAAGVRSVPGLASPFAATQAAWRFYANEHISLQQLASPIIDGARGQIPGACDGYILVAMDWSGLHLGSHRGRADRIELYRATDLGYELFTALALSDRDGRPLAPVVLELKARDGIYSSATSDLQTFSSHLDRLPSVMAQVCQLKLGPEPVFIIDREADSVGHFRQFLAEDRTFVVRAKNVPQVRFQDQTLSLSQVADKLQEQLVLAREVQYKGKTVEQYVASTQVTLTRPARTFRFYGKGQRREQRHKNIAGKAIVLRLIVSELRDKKGQVLTRWLLLSNLPAEIPAATVALWYYWRWRIESFHKLIKGAGLHVEHWQQETARSFSRRLLVAAMAVTLVWQLAASQTPEAATVRDLLIRLSGRQIKRGKGQPTYTIPALLAGLGALLPMLHLLETYSPENLRALLHATFPLASLRAESG
jgi:hypothetical protein